MLVDLELRGYKCAIQIPDVCPKCGHKSLLIEDKIHKGQVCGKVITCKDCDFIRVSGLVVF